MENIKFEYSLSQEEKRNFAEKFIEEKFNDNEEISDTKIKEICRNNFQEILSPDIKSDEEILRKLPLEPFIEGINFKWPEKYADKSLDRLLDAGKEKFGVFSLFNGDKLSISDIDEILPKLIEKIHPGEANPAIGELCMKALENPYYIKKSTFENWLTLLIKNFDNNVFSNLSQIFTCVDETDKNYPEKLLKRAFDKSGKKPKNPFSKALNDIQTEFYKNEKFENRRAYYNIGLRTLNKINDLLPKGSDITNSLQSLNNFLNVLNKKELPDSSNQIEYFLLNLFEPGRISFSFGNGTPSDINTVSNIFDLTIKFMTKPEVKKQFIQNMFERENCEAIAITKSKEILADLANLYDEQTKKYVISRLCELYKDKESLDADQPSTIRDCITKFIIKESEQTIKQEAFKMFSEVLDDNEKNNVYSEILRNDDEIPCADSYKIISMHKEIQENSFFSKDLKQNSIKNLCKLYKNLKNSPEKTIINSFMADVLLKYEENEIHIRDIVTTEFYSLLPESEKKSFLILVSDKCLNDEVAVSELPSSFLDEFFKADIELKRKETLIKIVINNFLDNEDEELLNRDWVNYVDEQTKATTLKALCDLYESSSDSVKQEKIKNRIEDFIINESDAKIKSDAFANFSKVLKLENKKNIYRTILNKDDVKKPEFGSYKILKMHEEIQDEASYPEDMKITSIENLCQFYGCKALSEQERSSIFTFMLNFIINYQKNELQVREKIFYEFYEKDFLKDKKNDFLKAIFNKSKNEPILLSELPESLKAEIIKSKDILPDEKKQLVESEFNNYLNKKAAGKIENNAVDFIVNFLVDGAIAIDTRKELLRKILEKTNRSNNEF